MAVSRDAYTCTTREAPCNFLDSFFGNVDVDKIRNYVVFGVHASGAFDARTSVIVYPNFSSISSGIKTLPSSLAVRYLTAPWMPPAASSHGRFWLAVPW